MQRQADAELAALRERHTAELRAEREQAERRRAKLRREIAALREHEWAQWRRRIIDRVTQIVFLARPEGAAAAAQVAREVIDAHTADDDRRAIVKEIEMRLILAMHAGARMAS